MEQHCIVVANAGRARIFIEEQAGGEYRDLSDMVNSGARLRAGDIETDRMGPLGAGKSIHGSGAAAPTSGYEPDQSPEEHETEKFIRSIVAVLLQQFNQGNFKHLVLIASPEFLGGLRALLDPRLKAAVVAEINKDYTQLSPKELSARIAEHRQKQ